MCQGGCCVFDRETFGLKLLVLRRKRKLSQSEIAELLGVTATQISDMENGKSGTTLEKLVTLCEYYQVSADYLLGTTDDPTWRGPSEEP